MEKRSFKSAFAKAGKSLYSVLPIILGTILLVGLTSLIPRTFYSKVFIGGFLDTLVGSVVGSISAGNPISSYILGGELLNQGVSLVAVTSFLVAWVTVGFVQLPAESMMLGKKFAILRNALSFVLAIVVAFVTVFIFNLIS